MNEIQLRRWHRIAHGSAILFGSVFLVIGIGAIGSGLTRSSAAAMTGMAMAQQASAQVAAGSTVVRLHTKVVRVSISNFSFQPARLVVSPGTRIVWANRDNTAHTVTSDKGIWPSGALNPGTQFVRVFAKGGTFAYHCSIHPFMHGTIVVKK
jgi:plastocyanin